MERDFFPTARWLLEPYEVALRNKGLGSERAPATPAMRGNPRPANDANPIEPRELDRFIGALSTDELELMLAADRLERLP